MTCFTSCPQLLSTLLLLAVLLMQTSVRLMLTNNVLVEPSEDTT
jgi:hypothetical protein